MTHADGDARAAADELLHFADKMGIDRCVVCLGDRLKPRPTAADLRSDNDYILRAVEHRPDRLIGFAYCSPNHPEASLAEIDRHIANGPMRGVKLWICAQADHPGNDPIVARCTELGVPVLQHTWLKATGNEEGESTPYNLAELARRHPRAQFLMAHSGGDWERGLRIIRHVPNIVADLCGGNPEQGQTELAVMLLGARRVVFGSDAGGRSFASQLAKVLGAEINEVDRALILGGNIARMMGL
ncbi:MAG: amidohydrolase family protein [Acidobacteriota bacterium]|nr:amidohydrolase family protein [Acidobacteriota bacterium]